MTLLNFFADVTSYDLATTHILIKPLVSGAANISLVLDFNYGGPGTFNIIGTIQGGSSKSSLSQMTPVINILSAETPMHSNSTSVSLSLSFFKSFLTADLSGSTLGILDLQKNLNALFSGGFETIAQTSTPYSTTILPQDTDLTLLVKGILAATVPVSFNLVINPSGFTDFRKISLATHNDSQLSLACALGGKASEDVPGLVEFIAPKPLRFTSLPNGKFKPIFPTGPSPVGTIGYHLYNAPTVTSGVEHTITQAIQFYGAIRKLGPSNQGPYTFNRLTFTQISNPLLVHIQKK